MDYYFFFHPFDQFNLLLNILLLGKKTKTKVFSNKLNEW